MKTKIAGLFALLCLMNCSYSSRETGIAYQRSEFPVEHLLRYDVITLLHDNTLPALKTDLKRIFKTLKRENTINQINEFEISFNLGNRNKLEEYWHRGEFNGMIDHLFNRLPEMQSVRVYCDDLLFALNRPIIMEGITL